MELIVTLDQRESRLHIERQGETIVASVDGRRYRLDARNLGAGVRSLLLLDVHDPRAQDSSAEIIGEDSPGGSGINPHFEFSVRARGDGRYWVGDDIPGGSEVTVADPLAHMAHQAAAAAGAGGPQQVTAYMPGRVTRILVQEGDEVKAGDGVLVLEAMKMENEIAAEGDGVMQRILVEEGQAVEGGDALFEIA